MIVSTPFEGLETFEFTAATTHQSWTWGSGEIEAQHEARGSRAASKMRVIVPLQGVLQGRLGIVFGSLIPCALFYFMQLRLRRSRQSQVPVTTPDPAPLLDADGEEAAAPRVDVAPVAERALAVLRVDPDVEAYYTGWEEATRNAFHSQRNPGGCIQLGLSENTLSLQLLEEWFATHDGSLPADVVSILEFKAIAGYPDVYHGLPIFRAAMATFMEEAYGGDLHFDAEKMVITTGATAAIELLAFCLAEPGDAFLVPAPVYSGFMRDVKWRSQVELVPVQSSSKNGFRVSRAALDEAFEQTRRSGRTVRALLLTSPSNPVGTVYDEDYLLLLLNFVRERDIHLVADEIYAGSSHGSAKVISFAKLVNWHTQYASRVHLIYGLSKILGIPGFRVGLLYSWNQQVLDAAGRMTRFSSASTQTQQVLYSLLSDKEFIKLYISENQKRLRERWRVVRHGLQQAGIEFVDCGAGFFCWMKPLPEIDSRESELNLFRELLYNVGLNITPGSACLCREPGWFRLCFAMVDDQTMHVALHRLRKFIIDQRA